MIALLLTALRGEPRRAAVLALLGALPVAVAVAVPAYVAAAERSIVSAEVAAAPATETSMTIRPQPPPEEFGPDGKPAPVRVDPTFEHRGPSVFATPGFKTIFAASFDVAPDPPGAQVWKLGYRDDVCRNVTLDAGRCPRGRAEVMVGPQTATALGLRIGSVRPYWQIRWVKADGGETVPVPEREPVTLSVVGVYRPTDPRAPYWGPVPPTTASAISEQVFTSRATAQLFALAVPEDRTFELVAEPGGLSADRVDRHPADLDRLREAALSLDADLVAGTEPLLGRIQASRAAVRALVPWLALPLVPLCWFVVFLAAAAGADARRTDLGQVALRGLPPVRRWVLAVGPDALALVAGAPLGMLVGLAAGGLAGGGPAPGWSAVGPTTWRYAAVAVAGALVAAALAYHGTLTTRTVDLLRRVPARGGRWRAAVLEVVVLALAVVAVAEARTVAGPVRGGLALLAPLLVVLAGALLAGRLLPVVARRTGARALREGRLVAGLAAVELARRPASRRTLTLASLALGLTCFAAVSTTLGGQARAERAAVAVGADRVLAVVPMPGPALRDAVREVDPAGAYAMAAVRVTGTTPVIAVDSGRLAAVGWSGSVRADDAALLRPALPAPVTVDGTDLTVEATVRRGPAARDAGSRAAPSLRAVLRLPSGAERPADLGTLRDGRRAYTAPVPCRPACRLVALEVSPLDRPTDLVLHGVRQTGPDRELVGAGSPDGRWRGAGVGGPEAVGPSVSPDAGGTLMRMPASTTPQRLASADAPATLPALHASATPPGTGGGGWSVVAPGSSAQVPITAAGEAPVLPGLGASGLLVDLEVLDRMTPLEAGGQAQVWLGAGAPADVVDRLAAAGVRTVEQQRASDAVALSTRSGVAVAARSLILAAGFALLLALFGIGLVAGAERADTAADARTLRVQGVRAATTSGVTLRRHLWPAAAALVAGPLLGALAWVAALPAVPLFPDTGWPVLPPVLPTPGALALPWAIGAAVMLAAALLAALPTRPHHSP